MRMSDESASAASYNKSLEINLRSFNLRSLTATIEGTLEIALNSAMENCVQESRVLGR